MKAGVGGRPVACFAAGWGSTSMPTSCCTLQVRNPQQADSSETLSTQITPADAADARRRCWRPSPAETLYAATHLPYTPVFAYMTQLRSPPRNPARCEFLQDARTSVRTPHMRCCWQCRVRCAATDWAAPAAGGTVGAALLAASSAEGEAAGGRPPHACMHAAIMSSRLQSGATSLIA